MSGGSSRQWGRGCKLFFAKFKFYFAVTHFAFCYKFDWDTGVNFLAYFELAVVAAVATLLNDFVAAAGEFYLGAVCVGVYNHWGGDGNFFAGAYATCFTVALEMVVMLLVVLPLVLPGVWVASL